MSANFFNGYSNDKPTSRVLNPPGGRSNGIFGGCAQEEPVVVAKPAMVHKSPQQEAIANKAHQQGELHLFEHNGAQKNQHGQQQQQPDRMKSTIFSEERLNSNQANKSRRGGFNPITGKSYDEEDDDRQKKIVIHEAHKAQQATDKADADAQHAADVVTANEKQAATNAANAANGHANGNSNGNHTNGNSNGNSNLHTSSRVTQPPGGKATRLW